MKRQSILALAMVILTATGTTMGDLSDGLIANYPFNGNANDASGHGHNGTVFGASLTIGRFGNINSAYTFDGTDDYITAPLTGVPASSVLTLSAWIWPNRDLSQGDTGAVLLARGEDFVTDRLWSSFSIIPQGNAWGTGVTLLYEDSCDTEQVCETDVFPQPNVWTHIAVTRSSAGELTIYSKGAPIGQWFGTPARAARSQDLTIRARWWSPSTSGPCQLSGFFPGATDDVRVYNRALSDTEVAELYAIRTPSDIKLDSIGLSLAGWKLRRRKES